MSTATSFGTATRGILKRGLEYLGTTVVGTAGMFLGVTAFTIPVLAIAEFVLSSSYLAYFSLLTIFGVSLFASQLMAHGQWRTGDGGETELSGQEKLVVAFTYYNLLVVAGTAFAVIAVSNGFPVVATAAALLAGPVDIELARRLNVSPLTSIVGTVFAIAYVLDWVRRPATGRPQPRDIAGISTLERVRRRGNDRFSG